MNKKNKTLYLFTLSYPYHIGGENTFLSKEIFYLAKNFEKIVLFPSIMKGKKDQLPPNVELNNFIVKLPKKKIARFKSIFSKHLWKEIIKKNYLKSPQKILRAINYGSHALLIKNQFSSFIKDKKEENILCYTYWCTSLTLGLCLVKKHFANIKVISRAHGIDLYEERGSVYLRDLTLKYLDKLYLISNNGLNYLNNRYPKYSSKYKVYYLGIDGPKDFTHLKTSNVLRIVSCSNVDKNKQVNVVFQGINNFAKIKSKLKIEWHHFGDGPLFNDLKNKIDSNLHHNLNIILHGYQPNTAIYNFYNTNFVSVFINGSISEGLPVSIMEAQSFGIPIIAPNVGGIPEILNHSNGILIPNHPGNQDITNALIYFYDNINNNEKFRINSRIIWENKFKASANFSSFSSELLNL